jgi:hypothetical protein
MKPRGYSGKPAAKTDVVDYSSSLTIAEFESGKSAAQRRVSFNSLISDSQINPEASIIISANPVLETLNDHKLLFFSSEYRESTLTALQAYRISTATRRELSADENYLNTVVLNSLRAFNTDYATCRSLGQDFLKTSTKILSDEHKSFAGLSIESIPYFDGATRSDHYQYDTKQVSVCFHPLPLPLHTNNQPSLLLAHELTHAIDDVHSDLSSCKLLFHTLDKNAKGNGRTQEAILDCAARIVDDDHKTFTKFYLPNLKEQWFVAKGRQVFYDRAKEWVDVMASSPDTNVFAEFDASGKRGLRCGSVPTEFLTFSIEHVFNALKESTNPDEFASKYETRITGALSKEDTSRFDLEIKKAALELIKDTTSAHLRLLQEHSTSTALSKCCDQAINVLESQYASFDLPSVAIARSSSIPKVEDVAPSLKREGSPPDPRDAQSEKKLDMDTKQSAFARRQSHPSIQNKLYSKDDSGIENIVEQMRERFKKSEKITNNTAIDTSNRNMGPRPRSR